MRQTAAFLLAALRDGRWLTAERVRVYGWMLLALTAAGSFAWVALSRGGYDVTGKPLGPDFLNVYAAGRMALAGRAADVYDWALHGDAERAVLPYDEYFGWHYPPMFLMLAAPLALMPYLGALALYMAATLAAYAETLRRLAGGRAGALVLALAFPAVFVNLGHGQNGFLTTALLGAALLALERRPLVAGVCFGLLAYKPQFGLLVPLALVAVGAWRAIAAATATVAASALAALLLFGLDTWRAFLGSLALTRTVVLEEGATGWEKIVSLYSAARALGAPSSVAYGLQAAGLAAAAVAVVLVWRRAADPRLRAAALVLALPLATPYVLDYDLAMLALPIAALACRGLDAGFPPWRRSLLAALYAAPLVARGLAGLTHLPPMQLLIALALASVTAEALGAGGQRTVP